MAKIFIKFLGNIKDAVGRESLEISVNDGESLEHILYSFCEKFGNRLRSVFFSKNGSLSENLMVFVNGKNAIIEKGLKTRMKGGDQLIIFSPVAGG